MTREEAIWLMRAELGKYLQPKLTNKVANEIFKLPFLRFVDPDIKLSVKREETTEKIALFLVNTYGKYNDKIIDIKQIEPIWRGEWLEEAESLLKEIPEIAIVDREQKIPKDMGGKDWVKELKK